MVLKDIKNNGADDKIYVLTNKEYYDLKNETKHLKGYIYDSLVYRYQLARYKASVTDARDMMCQKGLSKSEAEAEARRNYNRDIMRFCQILDEAIGEHD